MELINLNQKLLDEQHETHNVSSEWSAKFDEMKMLSWMVASGQARLLRIIICFVRKRKQILLHR